MNKKLQVFVSSTYTDLKDERQAAVEAILDAGHIPAGMELFKAGNESQLKTIYKWIDESDVYMLILGGRYGSIESNSGKSYTQLEYEYALSKNIPVFAVVLSESFLTIKIDLLGLSNIMEQETPSKYKMFKELVMSKIVRMVDDCKDIKITIHSTLNEFLNEYKLTGWVRDNNQHNDANKQIDIYKLKFLLELSIYLKNINWDADNILHNQNNLEIYANNIAHHIQELHKFYDNNQPKLLNYIDLLETIFSNTEKIISDLGLLLPQNTISKTVNGSLLYSYFVAIYNSSLKLIDICNYDISKCL